MIPANSYQQAADRIERETFHMDFLYPQVSQGNGEPAPEERKISRYEDGIDKIALRILKEANDRDMRERRARQI